MELKVDELEVGRIVAELKALLPDAKVLAFSTKPPKGVHRTIEIEGPINSDDTVRTRTDNPENLTNSDETVHMRTDTNFEELLARKQKQLVSYEYYDTEIHKDKLTNIKKCHEAFVKPEVKLKRIKSLLKKRWNPSSILGIKYGSKGWNKKFKYVLAIVEGMLGIKLHFRDIIAMGLDPITNVDETLRKLVVTDDEFKKTLIQLTPPSMKKDLNDKFLRVRDLQEEFRLLNLKKRERRILIYKALPLTQYASFWIRMAGRGFTERVKNIYPGISKYEIIIRNIPMNKVHDLKKFYENFDEHHTISVELEKQGSEEFLDYYNLNKDEEHLRDNLEWIYMFAISGENEKLLNMLREN